MAKMTPDQILDAVKEMTVLELNELVKKIEEEFGVTAAAPMAVAAMPGAAAAAPAEEEKTAFDVVLISPGPQKIAVVKEVRSITSLGLKESKDLVDGAPKAVKEGVTKDEADKLKAQLEEAGAVVEIK